MPKYVTIVIEINDAKIAKAELPNFHEKMVVEADAPWRVTAMSLDDEMTRLDLLEQASRLDDSGMIMADIFGACDIASKTISDFTDR